MPIAAPMSTLLNRIKRPRTDEKKPGWGKHSDTDMLADGLIRARDGWVADSNAIRSNGVTIAWNGPLDGQRFPLTGDETRRLKLKLGEFLEAKNSG